MKTVTVITVCFNAENEIEETLESVLKQSAIGFEYIIKDGGSTDGTLQLISSYKDRFIEKGINFKLVSGRDIGIFNAMNIALEYATGDYINYLNAGDAYYSKSTLEDIINYIDKSRSDVIYGHTMLALNNGNRFIVVQNHLNIFDGIFQLSCFVRRDCLLKYRFQECYSLLADYDLLIRLYHSGCSFFHANCIIGIYDRNGISMREFKRFTREMDLVKEEHGVRVFRSAFERTIILSVKTFLCKIFPMVSDRIYIKHLLEKSREKFIE